MNRLNLDRRAIACVITFGLVTTYMYLPFGFGKIFLEDILMGQIFVAAEANGIFFPQVNVMAAMGIPALGMVSGLLLAIFVTYRRPRGYHTPDTTAVEENKAPKIGKLIVATIAIIVCFVVQTLLNVIGSKADPLLVGTLVGLFVFLASSWLHRVFRWIRRQPRTSKGGDHTDDVFTSGMRMMALIGFIMITAGGFASVMTATGQIQPLIDATANLFGNSKGMAAFAMLFVGLLVTMGIGSSFATLPIIITIYLPLCTTLGFSPLATVAIIGTAGALGDAGSPPQIPPLVLPPASTPTANTITCVTPSFPPSCISTCRSWLRVGSPPWCCDELPSKPVGVGFLRVARPSCQPPAADSAQAATHSAAIGRSMVAGRLGRRACCPCVIAVVRCTQPKQQLRPCSSRAVVVFMSWLRRVAVAP